MPDGLRGGVARRLTVHLGVRDRAGHHSLVVELLARARRAEMAGATVLEATVGFGASGTVHRAQLWRPDTPLVLVLVDEPEAIDAFLHDAATLLHDVLVVVDDVTVQDR